MVQFLEVRGAGQNNLKNINIRIPRHQFVVITGVSGSGKSSLAFDTILAEANRRFFYTLSHYTRQFLDVGARPLVRSISGLSPAIALAQNETQPSVLASVGSLTDVNELFGVLFAKAGTQHCPTHSVPCQGQSIEKIFNHLLAMHKNGVVTICAPLAIAKRGTFSEPLARLAAIGYTRAFIDGQLVTIDPLPVLEKGEKHTIEVIIDQVEVSQENRMRILKSLEIACGEGDQLCHVFFNRARDVHGDVAQPFSTRSGCPKCGFSWPNLDARYFSPNSLGRCEDCRGRGYRLRDEEEDEQVEYYGYYAKKTCDTCGGTGVSQTVASIQLNSWTIHQVYASTFDELVPMVLGLQAAYPGHALIARITEEIVGTLEQVQTLGLGYLSPQRRLATLSGGELQRLKLASVLGENLKGVLYVLDEPSQGLHPDEIDMLVESIRTLKNNGNSILVVDHDEKLMAKADWLIDMGPGGGDHGGEVIAEFSPDEADRFTSISSTARALTTRRVLPKVESQGELQSFLEIGPCNLNNLRIDRVRFAKQALNVVTGVSGAGKTSLVFGELLGKLSERKDHAAPQGFERVLVLDRTPPAKSTQSMPVTFLDAYTDLRNLYAKLPEAQIAGLSARDFSLSVGGGRCETCGGRGQIKLTMRFLPDSLIPCDVCGGKRFQSHVLDVRYEGLNLNDVLNLTIQEALEVFQHHPRIQRKIQCGADVGLGYLRLGQTVYSLSGGEAQRLKLASILRARNLLDSLIILDEPSRGLHYDDIILLTEALHAATRDGATIVMIEHNLDLLAQSSWLIELGPGSADQGGRLLYEGPPEGSMATGSNSRMAFHLKQHLQ